MTQANKNQEILKEMFLLQDSLNKVVHSDWKTQNYPWYRAAWMEAAELLDEVGYKWWKKTESDKLKVHLELTDVIFFALSDWMIRPGFTVEYVEDWINQGVFTAKETYTPPPAEAIESFVQSTISTRSILPINIGILLQAFELTLEDIFELYIAKNCLNKFRQDNGYKEGTYHREWFSKDDNVVVIEELKEIKYATPKELFDKLYEALDVRYSALKNTKLQGW